MRRVLLSLALAAAVLSPPPGAALADTPGPEADRGGGRVAVYRGAEASVLPNVRVLRGSSSVGLPPASAAPGRGVEAVGGDRLWLVDPSAGELTACRLGASTRVGRDRVRCTRAELP